MEELAVQITSQDVSSSGFDSVDRRLDATAARLEQMAQNMGVLSGKGKEAASGLGEVGRIAAGVFAGISVEKAVSGLIAYHKTTMDTVAGLGSLADRYGVTTDQLQAYQLASAAANVTDKELNTTLGTFNLAIGAADKGNKDAIQSFDRLGIKILDANGKLRPNTELLAEVARALLTIENPAQRAAAAHDLLGDKGARLSPLLRQLTTNVDQLVDGYRQHGQIVDRDVIDRLDRAKNAGEAAQQGLTALYAAVAAPIHAEGLEYLARVTADISQRLRQANLDSVALFNSGMMQQHNQLLNDMAGKGPMTAAESQASDLDAARQKMADADAVAAKLQSQLNAGGLSNRSRTVLSEKLDVARESADAARGALAQLTEQFSKANDAALSGMVGAPTPPPGVTPTDFGITTGGKSQPRIVGGGTGASHRDRIQEGLNQIAAERVAAQRALSQMIAGAGVPLKDLMQQVELEKKIADEIAKLGKYDPKDPRVQQIRDEVTEREKAETALKRWTQAAQDADQVERQLGDGTLYLKEQTRQLNEDLATGRLSTEAYAFAMKNAREKSEDMRLTLQGQRGGVEGLMAGMELAANQWQRQNTAFAAGQTLMNDGFNLLKTTTNDWASTGVLDVQKFEQAFLAMLVNVGLALVQSELMKFLGGGAGGGMGGGFINNLLGGGGTTSSFGDFADFGGFEGFASGGRPPVGVPSMVGERGPELFVPDSAGTILPGGRGTGGDTAVVYMTNHFGSDVSRAELASREAIIERRAREGAIAGIVDAKSRGGAVRRTLKR